MVGKRRVYARVMRLVPLLPPATEIVGALELGDQLAGVTSGCDEPPSARADKTVVAGGLDTRRMTPRGDRPVPPRQARRRRQPVHPAQAGAGRPAARPDLDPGSVRRLRPPIRAGRGGPGIPGLPRPRAHPGSAHAGASAGLDPGGGPGHRGCRPGRAAGGRAACPARRRGISRCGAGPGRRSRWSSGRTRLPGEPSVAASWAEIANAAPELVVVAPCGYHLAGAADQARAAAQALPGLPVWAIDADGIIVRPGPRLVTGVEALAALLHPAATASASPRTIQRIA